MNRIKFNLKSRQKLQFILSLGLLFSSLLFTSNAFCDLKFEQEFAVIKVDLELDNMSSAVAEGVTIHKLSEEEEESTGAEMRINADFDENNKNSVNAPLEDFREDATAGHRIAGDDPDLLNGTLKIQGNSSIKGKWKLIFSNKIKVWKQKGTTYEEVISDVLSEEVTLPLNLNLKVEGIEGSQSTNDAEIKAEFSVTGTNAVSFDKVLLTVVKTEFMLTFDDGPYPTTEQVLTALDDFYVNGYKVKAVFFQVGLDGSESIPLEQGIQGSVFENPAITQKVNAKGHIVGNHTQHHQWFGPLTLKEEVKDEILACEAEIQIALAKEPVKIFRPPYLMDKSVIREGVKELGYSLIWGKTTGDVYPQPSVNDLITNALGLLKGWNTKESPSITEPLVLIFHDTSSVTCNNLEEIVRAFRDKGFILVDFDISRLISQITKP